MAEEISYEQALELLDRSLTSLEEGNLSLEDALKAVEDARRYLLICEARLDKAKRKIEVRPAGQPEAAAAEDEPPPADEPEPDSLFR